MEEYNYEMINIFNKNFISSDFKNIIRLYKKEITMVQFSEENNFKQEYIYQHPLFKNYNYCFFCEKKERTKYSNNLLRIHIPLKEKTIGEYLFYNKIKLRPMNNKKMKIARRRFINSYENKNKKLNDIFKCDNSDTELYINNTKDKIDIEEYKKIKNKNKKIKKKNNNNKINRNLINDFVEEIYSPLVDKNKIKDYSNNNNNNISDNLKLNLDEQDEIKTNYNINDEDSGEKIIITNKKKFPLKNSLTNNNKIESNDNISKKRTPHFSYPKNNINANPEEFQNSSGVNSDLKITITEKGEKEEKEEKEERNESNFSFEKNDDEKSNKSKNNPVMDVIFKTKEFFGFGRQSIKNINKRSSSHIRSTKLKKNMINYAENNCSICHQEIKEKFTLICGDFFCSSCIRDLIITAKDEITNLDKLSCPTCKERIEINTIKKLLSEKEFNEYKYLMTKIEAYRNEDYIPCPYPDCPDYAIESQYNTNIVICQNGHTFCKKCLEIINKNTEESEHKCFQNISEEEQKTLDFLKNNINFRKCPKCQNFVVREGGECNNMTCTNIWCGYEFCWICNGKYEESHYKNPISMCFGLGDIDNDRKLLKYSRIRFCRCLLIFLLLIFVILPVVIAFFSIFEGIIFVIAFVLDGSAMKNIKLKTPMNHKLFYKIVYGFFLCLSIAFIPFGYISLALLIIAIPILCIYYKITKKDGEDLE